MLFGGAVFATDQTNCDQKDKDSANVSLNVTVLDQNCDPVTEAARGDKVTTQVTASTNKPVKDPVTKINIDPEHGINFLPDEAQMWDGQNWITNDPCDPFFYQKCGTWIWDMGDFLSPCDQLILKIPGIVCNVGDTTVNADLFGTVFCHEQNDHQQDGLLSFNNNGPGNNHDNNHNDKCLLASDNYTFNALMATNASVKLNISDPATNEKVNKVDVDDAVNVEVIADAANEIIKDPYVLIHFNPGALLNFDPATVMMWNGTSWITNDLMHPFFYEEFGVWKWDLGDMMNPGDVFKLLIPATAVEAGNVSITADLFGQVKCDPSDPCSDFLPSSLLSSDPAILEIVNESAAGGGETGNAAGGGNEAAAGSVVSAANETSTVPMQTTGAPLVMAVLALLAILGGSVYGKLR